MRVNDRMIKCSSAAGAPRRTAWSRLLRGVATLAALLPLAAIPARAQGGQTYTSVTLPPAELNANFRQHFGPIYSDGITYPTIGTTGAATFGGVPFTIPVIPGAALPLFVGTNRYLPTLAESNMWLSAYYWDGANQTQAITGSRELNLTGTTYNQVPDIYALMGTWWGRRSRRNGRESVQGRVLVLGR
jgi:hypothetical protein